MLSRRAVRSLIQSALREDGASRDVTSRAVLPAATRIRAQLIAKDSGILAGGSVAARTFHMIDPAIRCTIRARDGSRIRFGQTLLTIEGKARAIFAAERTALNLLGHLSGVATLTRRFADRVRPFQVQILDTRKTLPGLRPLERYAVRVGGGHNHRADLHQAVLIKTNHLRAAQGTIQAAVMRATRARPRRFVEIEVANLREFRAALAARPDAVLLDNWPVAAIRRAVRLRTTRTPLLEVSGGVTLANVHAIAKTGVDRISIGRLTHSAPTLDCSLQVADGTL